MTIARLPWAYQNLRGPDRDTGRRHRTIDSWLDHAKRGIGGASEVNSADNGYIKLAAKARGCNVAIFGHNAVAWNPKVVRVNSRNKLIAPGGAVGGDGVAGVGRDQKVGPNRYCIFNDVVLVEAPSIEPFEVDWAHLPHQAFTRSKWKAPLWFAAIRNIGAGVRRDTGMAGADWNRNYGVDLPGIPDRHTDFPATMGRQHYDFARAWGRAWIEDVYEFGNPSDHDGIGGVLVVWSKDEKNPPYKVGAVPPAAKPKPPVKRTSLPRPGQKGVRWKARWGAPVEHPWSARVYNRSSARMKKRILAWRKAYNRRRAG